MTSEMSSKLIAMCFPAYLLKVGILGFGCFIITEFRFKSPISISKLNNYPDFGRKSENYSKVKVFPDSRPKSAKTFDESLQILSPRKSATLAVITPEFREKVRI